MSAALEKTDTPILNNIPNDIISTDDIDYAIGVLTSHITAVVENSTRVVPAKSDHKDLPSDVIELIRAKNAAFWRANEYPTCKNRSHAHALQRKVKARMKEVRNKNWSNLMSEISPSHQAYWGLAKALKTEGAVPSPALKKPDKFIAFDDREKAECLADSIKQQCTENPPYDSERVMRVEEQTRQRVSLPPKDDLDPISQDEISRHIKALKIRKAPGRDSISSKAFKCFFAPFVALLVTIFNECIRNCYFPAAWKEAVVIDIPKPGKPRDLPASYRPISLLSILEGFKVKRKTVAVFFDVAKVFDRVWHTGLFHKLYQLEFPDCLVIIIHHYISNRHFSFRLDNTYSSMRPIRAGVLQGSTLFPPLYSVYVNDIPRPSTGIATHAFRR
ncbi:RNA-directed DNA polymerase from mobile element jockey [Eumeta japonica]|uniref:RNA-directed DNA polymerase from mobile element jockey n=1 Tax=Eumeta variegata TaxID=151549 RepID=A0A4C1ZKQ5_EUMVA|nr:RNA-directed DNA polymerase from mobile element jockey [Eumeta japonica]